MDDRRHASPAFGLGAWSLGDSVTARQFAEQAELAERLGFHSFWLPENHFVGPAALPAPLLLLAAAAARTERIRLGTGSYLLPIRHPVQMAEEVAVLDRLSSGRVILGVGRGYLPSMFAAFDLPATGKRERFEHALARMVAAWAGEPVAWEGAGEGAVSEPVFLAPRPLQRPHPPIWVAAFGPKALAQAGRLGLPYLASPVETLAGLEENFTRHREAAAAAGRPVPPEVPVMRTVYVSRDRGRLAAVRDLLAEQAGALARSPVASLRRGAGRSVEDWAIVGEPAAVRDQLGRCVERLRPTHLIASRTRLPGLSGSELRGSVELLAEIAAELGAGAQSP